jgi:hypothetical protein
MGKGGSWPGAAVINGMDCPLTTTAVGVAGTEIVKMLLDDQAAKLLSSEVANMSQMLVHSDVPLTMHDGASLHGYGLRSVTGPTLRRVTTRLVTMGVANVII